MSRLKIKKTLVVIIIFLSFSVPAINAEVSPEYFAQWHINYASYLIDVGKYLEAHEAYNAAFEATDNRQIRLNVLINKASLLATFLDESDEALKIYEEIIGDYPEKADLATYRKGLLLFDLGRYKETVKVFETYLQKYPGGRFRFSVEVILGKAKKEVAPPPPEAIERQEVRVLLHKNMNAIAISGQNMKINDKTYSKDTADFIIKNDGIFLDNTPLPSDTVVSSEPPLKVSVDNKHKRVRGKIHIQKKDKGFMVINKIDMELYLMSVVPSESYASWPLEALKGQAVAARTYALYQILHRKNMDYDLVDNEGDQAYKGVERETKRTTQAVKETEGLVLIVKDKPILAMFTANSGGYTADAGTLFKVSKPYLIAHPDPSSLKGKMSQWEKKFTVNEVEENLRKRGLGVTGLKDIAPAEKDQSGRIIKVSIIDEKGSKIFRTWNTLRRALDLPEILFEIQRTEDTFIFEGRGWGHGIGYSQWGAAIMGENNDYKEILKFYYPNTSLIKMW